MLNYYNEPLLDPSLFQKIREMRERLPENIIGFDSNGDFLTRDNLDLLAKSGLNWLLVTRHIAPGAFDMVKCKESLRAYIEKLDLLNCVVEQTRMHENNVSYKLGYMGMEIYVVCNNWSEIGCDRGGVIDFLQDDQVRISPCINPIREFCISYEGKVKPCCNIYFGEHTDCGDVNEGILTAYFDKLCAFKTSMFLYGEKMGGVPVLQHSGQFRHSIKRVA